jgi:hypothetical protein
VIGAGEQRLYREIRSSTQEVALTLTVASNAAPLPTDFIEMKGSLLIGNGFATANYLPQQQLQDALQLSQNTQTSGPYYYTFQSDTVVFYPTQPTGVVITGTYYKRFPDISTGLNALFTRHPDLFMYAALSESAPFLGEMTRMPVWEKKYTDLVSQVNEFERRRYSRGSKLQTRIG